MKRFRHISYFSYFISEKQTLHSKTEHFENISAIVLGQSNSSDDKNERDKSFSFGEEGKEF